MKRVILPLAGLVLLTCGWVKDPIVVKVGDYVIRKQDVEYRNALLRQSGAGSNPQVALSQLERAYTYAQILKNNGHPLTENLVLKEEERIDKTSLMPKKLAEIRALFGQDQDAYRRVYVLPELAERTIYYEFFRWDPVIQAPAAKEAEVFLKKVARAPKAFGRIAKAEGHQVLAFSVNLYDGIHHERAKAPSRRAKRKMRNGRPDGSLTGGVPSEVEMEMKGQAKRQASEEGSHWIKDIIRPLKAGKVHPEPIEQQESWLVVRYLRRDPRNKDTYRLEGVSFPKEDYGRWMEGEKQKVDVSRTEEAENISRS